MHQLVSTGFDSVPDILMMTVIVRNTGTGNAYRMNYRV